MTTTPAQQAGTLLHGLLAQFEGDVLGSAQGLLATFFANLSKTPTSQNVIAQGIALAATAPLQLPALESTAIAQFAAVGQQLTALIPSVLTPPTPAA